MAFPIFLLGIEWVRGHWRRQGWLPLGSMLGASVVAGVRLLYVASHTKGAGLGSGATGITPWKYLLAQPKVILNYLALFLYPIGQNFDHDIMSFSSSAWVSMAAWAGLAALVALALWRLKPGVWVLGALVLLAPSSSVIPLADLMFEHRMYLPMISLAAGVGVALERLRWPVPVALALALAATSGARARVWASEETLWSDAAARSPRKVRPKLQLARAVEATDPQRAASLLLEARRLDPVNPETFTQMGTLLLEQRNASGALDEFDEAVRLQPGSADAHSNRGTALYLLARPGEAEAEFEQALALDPCHYNAWHNLLVLYKTPGDEAARRRLPRPPAHCRFTPEQHVEMEQP